MRAIFWALLLAPAAVANDGRGSAEAGEPAPAENSCIECHGERDLWDDQRLRLYVASADFADDIHWQSGLRCHDCHGGDPTTTDVTKAHSAVAGYRRIGSPADIPEFCGSCHSDGAYLRRFDSPSRSDQLAQYWTSGHGQRLKKRNDLGVATCVSCHGHHGVRRVGDARSPIFPANLADTCATCHAEIAALFAQTRMRHQFAQVGLPSCATCHGSHDIRSPASEKSGLGFQAVCIHCHAEGHFGAPFAGPRVASGVFARMEQLKTRLAEADAKLSRAERLAVDVAKPREDLYRASGALANARTSIHGFSFDPMDESLDEGIEMADRSLRGASDALYQHRARRLWLGTSVIAAAIASLLGLRYVWALGSRRASSVGLPDSL